MKKVYFVSSNPGKRKEMAELLGPYLSSIGLTLDFTDLEVSELQASGSEIIADKLEKISTLLPEALICEDSALCFKAWNDFPGVYIKHVREAVTTQGLFRMLEPFEDKSARAECRIGLAVPAKEKKIFTGLVQGLIVSPRGDKGFGWDPLFIPAGHSESYAEMQPEIKNRVSDRALAVQSLVEFLQSSPDWLTST